MVRNPGSLMINQSSEQEKSLFIGRYCYLKYLSTTPRGNFSISDVEYCYCSVGSPNGTEEEQIAFFISGLPNPKLLDGGKNLCQGVLDIWVAYKDSCVELAKCFLFTKGKEDDPFLESLSKKEINRSEYEYEWLKGELYKNLWHLIHHNSELIIKSLQKNWDYYFVSDIDLMCEIVRGVIEGEFSRYLLNIYQYNASEIDDINKLKRKMHRNELSVVEKEKLWNLIDKHTAKAIWFDRVITIANALADHGINEIKTNLDIHSKIIDAMARFNIKRVRNPALRSPRKSHYCVEGVITEGTIPKWKLHEA